MWRGMNVSFRDMLFLLVFAYLVVGAIALAHVHKKSEEAQGSTPPGDVIVDIRWDAAIDADVDLWVQAPGDVPVGYSNKAGVSFNLVRDDLGKTGDPFSMNYEIAYGRGIIPGEYAVNAHLYRSVDHVFPIKVTATVSTHDKDGRTTRVLATTAELAFQGQETTLFRFKLTPNGQLIESSLNRIHKSIRSQWLERNKGHQ